MKIAYLMSIYPMTSTTFIRREIEALERLGVEVERYAVRRWNEKMVDARDVLETKRTRYFLSSNVAGLLTVFLHEVLSNPKSIWRGIVGMRKLAARSHGHIVKHFAYLLQAVYLVRQAQRDRIQHVHSHFSTNATAVAMLSRLMGGPSYSFTAHGPDEFDNAKPLSLDDKLFYASFVAAISHFCKGQLLRCGGFRHADKIHIIHCGLDLKEFAISDADSGEALTLVCVGRLCNNKGQVLIPEVVAKLKANYPSLKVILIGDGEARRDIEKEIAAWHVEQQVMITGWLANDAVRDQIRKSRALLLPSFAEGLPIVIMEALALGRPVISTYIAGIPELLDSTCGWIVPAGSVEDLKSAVRAALDASPAEIAGLGQAGRARVVAGFDVNESARMLASHFEEAISSTSKS